MVRSHTVLPLSEKGKISEVVTLILLLFVCRGKDHQPPCTHLPYSSKPLQWSQLVCRFLVKNHLRMEHKAQPSDIKKAAEVLETLTGLCHRKHHTFRAADIFRISQYQIQDGILSHYTTLSIYNVLNFFDTEISWLQWDTKQDLGLQCQHFKQTLHKESNIWVYFILFLPKWSYIYSACVYKYIHIHKCIDTWIQNVVRALKFSSLRTYKKCIFLIEHMQLKDSTDFFLQ